MLTVVTVLFLAIYGIDIVALFFSGFILILWYIFIKRTMHIANPSQIKS